MLTAQINDQQNPYRTLQTAIDAVHAHLVTQFTAGSTVQGVVYALPGIYGPAAVGPNNSGSGDVLPIRMRDRVSVRGLGARRCTMRGASTTTTHVPTSNVFWPFASLGQSGGGSTDAEIILDWGESEVFNVGGFWNGLPNNQLPWASQGDTAELLDAFTFEGGDVQVMISMPTAFPQSLSGRITNCVFDMRHGWQPFPGAASRRGPTFGVMMTKNLVSGGGVLGFSQQNFLIANNTFVMTEFNEGSEGFTSKVDAVGIIDVTSPCTGTLCYNSPGNPRELLGIGNPVVANNLFRTRMSPSDQRRPMLGIDTSDTMLKNDGGQFVPANAFVAWAGASSHFSNSGVFSGFWSRPVPTTFASNGTQVLIVVPQPLPATLPAPVPAVTLWGGSTTQTNPLEVDASFVGEYLSSELPPVAGVLPGIDYRLMPYSDLRDKGVLSAGAGGQPLLESSGGLKFEDPLCAELASYRWDGEGHGNPRVVDKLDIGFDEIDSILMAGTWANHSNSHHNPSPQLQPNALLGRAQRLFIFDNAFAGRDCTIHGAGVVPGAPPAAWSKPPETLNSTVLNPAMPGLPYYRRTKYIRFTDVGSTPTGPNGWQFTGANAPVAMPFLVPVALRPPGNSLTRNLARADVADLDTAGLPPSGVPQPNLWFGMQGELTWSEGGATIVWWTNLQSEYR